MRPLEKTLGMPDQTFNGKSRAAILEVLLFWGPERVFREFLRHYKKKEIFKCGQYNPGGVNGESTGF